MSSRSGSSRGGTWGGRGAGEPGPAPASVAPIRTPANAQQGPPGLDAALIYIAVGSGSTWSSQWPPRPKERSPARSPGSGFTVVPGEHASRSAPGHGARPSQQGHRLGAGLPPLMGGADRRDGGVGGGRRAQLLCPGRAGSHAPASRCSVQEPRGRRRPGEHAQTANVRGLQPPAPCLLL